MVDDEIVQTIKIEVEDDQASSALDKIGESASASFEQLQNAAKTAGVSIEQFGQLSEKTQQQYIELSQRVQQSSQQMVQSTQELQQAAGAAGGGTRELGGGLDEVSEKSGISSREMRGVGKIMRELGAGEAAGLALTFQKVGSSLGALGVAALALAMVGGTLAKFAKDAADAAKGMEELAKASGASVQSLKLQEGAFQSAGIAAKDYQKSIQGLLVTVVEGAPRIGQQIAESAKKVLDADAALKKVGLDDAKLRLQTRELKLQGQVLQQTSEQLVFQKQQLEIQSQQLALSLGTIQQRLATLSQEQAIQRAQSRLQVESAHLSVQDAEANLKKLQLKRQLETGLISEASYLRQIGLLDNEAELRAIKKAKIEVENAKLNESNARLQKQKEQEQQAEQRESLELQRRSVELQLQQLPAQLRAIQLQEKQNELARQRLAIDKKKNEIDVSQADQRKELDLIILQGKLNEALANSLGPLIDKLERMRNGSKELIDPLTSLESRTQALTAVLARAGISAEDMAKGFNVSNVEVNKFLPIIARLYDDLTGLQKLKFDEVLKGLKLSDDLIAVLRKGTEELDKFMEKAKELAPARQQLEDAGKGMDALGKAFKDFATSAAGSFVATFREAWDDIKALGTAIKDAGSAIAGFVTTPVAGAWQWLTSSFNAALEEMKQRWAEFQRSLTDGGALPLPSGSGAHAAGGLLGGRGTGTSDSNLAWVSRGEYITPAGAVQQPGVLAFLEALRHSGGNLRSVLEGMGHFARGGLVMPTLPAFAGGGMSNVTINFPGLPEITGLRASSGVVSELQRAAALAQVRSGGRKPSRYS